MRKFNQEQLENILKNHKLWVNDPTKGVRADLSGADLSGTNLSRANLSGTNLSRANLSRSDLFGTNLSGADLSGADLCGTNLYGADLSGADLSWAVGVVGFYLGRYFGFMSLHNKHVQIGCEGMPLDDWLEKYEELATKHGYPGKIVQKYLNFGRYLKENF